MYIENIFVVGAPESCHLWTSLVVMQYLHQVFWIQRNINEFGKPTATTKFPYVTYIFGLEDNNKVTDLKLCLVMPYGIMDLSHHCSM